MRLSGKNTGVLVLPGLCNHTFLRSFWKNLRNRCDFREIQPPFLHTVPRVHTAITPFPVATPGSLCSCKPSHLSH